MFKHFTNNQIALLLNGLRATHVISMVKEHAFLVQMLEKELKKRGIRLASDIEPALSQSAISQIMNASRGKK